MRDITKNLESMVLSIEALLGLKLLSAFRAFYVATDFSVEEIFHHLIKDLEPQEYVQAGFIISNFLNSPRELILRDRTKVFLYLKNVSHSGYSKDQLALSARNFRVPSFAKNTDKQDVKGS